jgi:hypothetical protein
MLTTPDHSDAVASPAAFSPVGPKPQGFYLDCDSATGQEGTVYRAEDFNELILNLRKLLTVTQTAGLKGSPDMLVDAFYVRAPLTLNVATTGTPTPANPRAGDAFDSLTSALAWLNLRRLSAPVTIAVAAGTYQHTAQLLLMHPDLAWVTIRGAGTATTVLRFTGPIDGLVLWNTINSIEALEVRGDNVSPNTHGLVVYAGILKLGALLVTQWAAAGISAPVTGGSVSLLGDVEVKDGNGTGIYIGGGAWLVCDANQLTVRDNLGDNVVVAGGGIRCKTLETWSGQHGLVVTDGGRGFFEALRVYNAVRTTEAVLVSNGASLAPIGSPAGTWLAQQYGVAFHTMRAEYYGLMRTLGALEAGTRGVTSPAVNTLGNTQAYIQAN